MPMRLFRLAVGGGVELLLRELRHQQPQALQVLGVQDAAEDLLEVVDGHDLALRDVAQVGPRRQVDGRRELGKEVLGQVEIDVEALQAGQQLDLHLGKDHAAGLVLGMGQRQKSLGEQSLVADLIAGHRGQLLPGHSLRQLRRRADLDRLAARHRHFAVGPRGEIVALLQQLLLAGHDRLLVGLVPGHHGLETLLAQQNGGNLVVARRRGVLGPSTMSDRHNSTTPRSPRLPNPAAGVRFVFVDLTPHGLLLKCDKTTRVVRNADRENGRHAITVTLHSTRLRKVYANGVFVARPTAHHFFLATSPSALRWAASTRPSQCCST